MGFDNHNDVRRRNRRWIFRNENEVRRIEERRWKFQTERNLNIQWKSTIHRMMQREHIFDEYASKTINKNHENNQNSDNVNDLLRMESKYSNQMSRCLSIVIQNGKTHTRWTNKQKNRTSKNKQMKEKNCFYGYRNAFVDNCEWVEWKVEMGTRNKKLIFKWIDHIDL